MIKVASIRSARNSVLVGASLLLLAGVVGCPPSGPVPTAPTIGLSLTSLTFTAVEGGPNPGSRTVGITNAGADTLNWSVSSDAAWCAVDPAGGSTTTGTDEVTVSVDTAGLTAAGSPYTAVITIVADDATNSPQTVQVTLTLNDPTAGCQQIPSVIDTDTTLSAGCYVATSSVSVRDGATLTLDPGVTIIFQDGKEMTVYESGRLSAAGTADQSIVFTGEERIRGYWGGLRFYQSNSTENQLDYVTVEYGGGYWDGNLYLDGSSSSPARVTISNCTLRESGSYGFVFDETVVEEFSNNVVTQNTLGAGNVSPEDAGWLDDTSTYTGNDVDVVRMWSGTVGEEVTWPGIDANYLVAGSVSISALLTIEPGAHLLFEQGREVSVYDDGRLVAVGSAGDPITLSGEEDIRGYWGGLRFYRSNSMDNRLEYVIIEQGGGYWDANLYLDGGSDSPARVDIVNCTFRESGSYGFVFDDAVVEEFTDNTVTENTLGAGNVSPDDAGWLDDSGTYTGNDADVVRVWSGSVSMDAIWPGIDADYLIAGNISVNAMLNLDPEARLVFDQGREMSVYESGQLSAVGTVDQPILFTGVEATPGYWGGLRFYQSNSAANRLDYVTIEYGGGYWNANLRLDGSSSSPVQIDVTNCTITDSETWGIYIDDANVNADIETVNTFSGNADGNVFWQP